MVYKKIHTCEECGKETVARSSLKRFCADCKKLNRNRVRKEYLKKGDNLEKHMVRVYRWRENNWEKYLQINREWTKNNRDKMYVRETLWKKRNPEKYKAKKAIQSNNIPIGKECQECGSKKNLQRHHPDYSKPLFIVTLCAKCHSAVHHNKIKLEVKA